MADPAGIRRNPNVTGHIEILRQTPVGPVFAADTPWVRAACGTEGHGWR